MQIIASIAVDSVTYGMTLFVIAVGLSVTLGLIRVVNLAHGLFAVLGGYFAWYAMTAWKLGYFPAAIIAIILTAIVGLILERSLFSRVYRRNALDQVLLSIGIMFVGIAACGAVFGDGIKTLPLPPSLSGPVELGFRAVPAQRLLVIACGAAVVLGSLSPRMTVGQIVAEGLLVHEPGLSFAERDRRAVAALTEVGLDPNARNRYPHEFSGGQRQRIAIARAMILKPKVVVLDEPTSALDRSVQKQIVELLRGLQDDNELSYLFISHDLAVVRAMADYVMVMKEGRVVEEGPTGAIFEAPREAYTQALMEAAINKTRFRADASPAP